MIVNTKFKINKEKGVIVCIVTATDDIYEIIRKYRLYTDYTLPTPFSYKIYKGIARCAPEDKWDETYGKRLAEYRAVRARQIDVNNKLKDLYKRENIKLSNLINYGLLKTPKHPNNK